MSFIEIVEEEETFELKIGKSTLTLRRFDTEVYRKIEARHTKKQKNFRQGGWIKEVDDFAVNEDLLDYMIVGWKDVKSPITGEDVPCSREMKIKLPSSVKIEIIEACDSDNITGADTEILADLSAEASAKAEKKTAPKPSKSS